MQHDGDEIAEVDIECENDETAKFMSIDEEPKSTGLPQKQPFPAKQPLTHPNVEFGILECKRVC
jgi:hypothetical protein